MTMNSIKKNWGELFLVCFMFVLPFVSFAQSAIDGEPCDTSGKICNPIPKITSVPGLIHDILVGVLRIGIPFVALAIIYSGFLFVAARGNSEKLNKAKDSLVYTVIGAAILLGSWGIAEMISNTMLAL